MTASSTPCSKRSTTVRPDYPIRTERLVLRPFDLGDLDDVLVYRSLPEITEEGQSRGMRREAHLRHCEIVKGEWGDRFVYAMLAGEHRQLK